MTKAGTKAMLAVLLVAGSTASAASAADNDALVSYIGPQKLKVERRLPYEAICSASCELTARTTLVLPHREVGPLVAHVNLPAGEVAEPYMRLNKVAFRVLRQNARRSHLRTELTGEDRVSGDTDTDVRVFGFK